MHRITALAPSTFVLILFFVGSFLAHAQIEEEGCFRRPEGLVRMTTADATLNAAHTRLTVTLAGRLSSALSSTSCKKENPITHCSYYQDVATQTVPPNTATIENITDRFRGFDIEDAATRDSLVGQVIPLSIFPGEVGTSCARGDNAGTRSVFTGSQVLDVSRVPDGVYQMEIAVADKSGKDTRLIVFTIDRENAVAANAAEVTLTLSNFGLGRVQSASIPTQADQFDCAVGAGCSEEAVTYPLGSAVTLTPVPGPGHYFAGWFGHPDCVDGEVIANTSKACVAAFPEIGGCYTKTEIGTFIDGVDVGTEIAPHYITVDADVHFDVRPADYEAYIDAPETNPAIVSCDVSEGEANRRYQIQYDYPFGAAQTWDMISPWSELYHSFAFSEGAEEPLAFTHTFDEPGVYTTLSSITWRSQNPETHPTTSLNARKTFHVTAPAEERGSITVQSNVLAPYNIVGQRNISWEPLEKEYTHEGLPAPGTYTLSAEVLPGYTEPQIEPTRSQILLPGEEIEFTVTYKEL